METVERTTKEKQHNTIPEIAGNISGLLGRGLAAGLSGTAAITLSQMIDMKITNRSSSETPVKAAGKVIGFEPRKEEKKEEGANESKADNKERLNNLVHFAYGTSWGEARALISSFGLRGWKASLLHFAAVWSTALVMLPALKVAPPVKKWEIKEILKDAGHHLVYAFTTGYVFDKINKQSC